MTDQVPSCRRRPGYNPPTAHHTSLPRMKRPANCPLRVQLRVPQTRLSGCGVAIPAITTWCCPEARGMDRTTYTRHVRVVLPRLQTSRRSGATKRTASFLSRSSERIQVSQGFILGQVHPLATGSKDMPVSHECSNGMSISSLSSLSPLRDLAYRSV